MPEIAHLSLKMVLPLMKFPVVLMESNPSPHPDRKLPLF